MKQINHNYWEGYEDPKHEADKYNPDLRRAMQKLYGRKGFDFGKVGDDFYDTDKRNQYRPDGYSTYTSLDEKDPNYWSKMKFRENAIENNKEISDRCDLLARTIAGELFFPCRELNGKTINQMRGTNGNINDMMYLTLENIRKYYEKEPEDYPLKETIERYGYFFDRFNSFDEYIEYNFLQDFELLPKKFPANEEELVEYWKKSIEFLEARLKRIEKYAIQNNLFEK
ncbi:hypothetical protein LJC08_04285 [Methanimicrococcus sp. OttesenSCG-928-J09]|nr:hypothetical protein [Methanimicrococcus sp. OttesenSCG-928-J09]